MDILYFSYNSLYQHLYLISFSEFKGCTKTKTQISRSLYIIMMNSRNKFKEVWGHSATFADTRCCFEVTRSSLQILFFIKFFNYSDTVHQFCWKTCKISSFGYWTFGYIPMIYCKIERRMLCSVQDLVGSEKRLKTWQHIADHFKASS